MLAVILAHLEIVLFGVMAPANVFMMLVKMSSLVDVLHVVLEKYVEVIVVVEVVEVVLADIRVVLIEHGVNLVVVGVVLEKYVEMMVVV